MKSTRRHGSVLSNDAVIGTTAGIPRVELITTPATPADAAQGASFSSYATITTNAGRFYEESCGRTRESAAMFARAFVLQKFAEAGPGATRSAAMT